MHDSAFSDRIRQYRFSNFESDLFDEQLPQLRRTLELTISQALSTLRSYKLRLCVSLVFHRDTNDEITSELVTSTGTQTIYPWTNVSLLVEGMISNIECTATCTEMEGSGWIILKIQFAELNFAQYDPLNAGGFIELPESLRRSRSLINVHNTDGKCFQYAVLAAIHDVVQPTNPESYSNLTASLDFSCLRYPVPLNYSTVAKFEATNQISVSIFGFEGEVFPLRISALQCNRYVRCSCIGWNATLM